MGRKISTYPVTESATGRVLGSLGTGQTVQFDVSNFGSNMNVENIKSIIALEGRPVKLTQSRASDGSDLNWTASTSSYGNIGAGSITIAPGRAIYIESILLSTDQPGMIFGFMQRNSEGVWIGSSFDDQINVATPGGAVSVPVNSIFGESFRLTLSFTPYPVETPTAKDPNLAVMIKGVEFTNDFNFHATKKMLYCGDSISWSLVGDWRTQDQTYNLAGSSQTFPAHFGDSLASFKLVKRLRNENGESIRLVNKGFGGSKLSTDQWVASKIEMYTLPWNIMVMQAGVNDAVQIQDPLFQLNLKSRMQDIVQKRDDNGREDYPIVFCNTPSLDDRGNVKGSRNNLDVRVPLSGNSEDYDVSFDINSTTGVNVIDLESATTDRTVKVFSSTSATQANVRITGGVAGEVYRIDVYCDNVSGSGFNLKTAGDNATNFVEVLDNRLFGEDEGESTNVKIDANSTLFLKCVALGSSGASTAIGYLELERVALLGSELESTSATFNPETADLASRKDHFITSGTTEAQITGPDIARLTQTDTIPSGSANVEIPSGPGANINTVVFKNLSGGTITSEGLPSSANLKTNDVWVRIYGLSATGGTATDQNWSDMDGFYRLLGYTENSGSLETITVDINAQRAIARNLNVGIFGGGSVDIIKSRDYIAQFEGTASNTSESNSRYFEHGQETIGNYKVLTQLKGGSAGDRFYLTSGRGICFSVYQQGNVIYMNEIISGNIINSGYIIGADTEDSFYAQSEVGQTRLKTVNSSITEVVEGYTSSDNVHRVNLYDSSDVRNTTETTAGRIRYNKTAEKNENSGITDEYDYKLGDLIEDPNFKRVGDSGINECVIGERLHRSPKGHDLLYQRLWSTIGSLTIPD